MKSDSSLVGGSELLLYREHLRHQGLRLLVQRLRVAIAHLSLLPQVEESLARPGKRLAHRDAEGLGEPGERSSNLQSNKVLKHM